MGESGLTDEEINLLLANAAAVPEEKINAHSFLKKVVETGDTTKVGYLKEEEVGIPTHSMRTLKDLALYCSDIADEQEWSQYFIKRAEILSSTSLSKNAKLIDLAVIQRREVSDVTPAKVEMKENKGWFRKKKYDAPQPNM